MKALVSLWSADLLAVGSAIDELETVADGFHVDVMDGHYVPELLFGPDFVRAVCGRTERPVDVHLMVTDADVWIPPFIAAGCASVTIHPESSPDPGETLRHIEQQGANPCLAVSVEQPMSMVEPLLGLIDRVLIMGTALGIKGADLDPRTFDRVREAVELRDRSERRPAVFVDGGIRRHTVPDLAAAGADGVIPGSLVLGDADAQGALRWIGGLHGRTSDGG